VTTNQILFGLGLVLVLAVGSQLLARVLRVPALVLLLLPSRGCSASRAGATPRSC